MKKTNFLMVVSILLIVTGGCSKDSMNSNAPDEYKLEKGDFMFLKNADTYALAKEQRSDNYSAEFEIDKVERIADTMNITVSYHEGCGTNKFEVIWDGTIMESYPEMTIFFVKRTATNCGTQGALKTQVLSLRLTEIIENEALAKRISITVSNASKTANAENSDVAISNKN